MDEPTRTTQYVHTHVRVSESSLSTSIAIRPQEITCYGYGYGYIRHYSSLRRSNGVPWQVERIQMPYTPIRVTGVARSSSRSRRLRTPRSRHASPRRSLPVAGTGSVFQNPHGRIPENARSYFETARRIILQTARSYFETTRSYFRNKHGRAPAQAIA